MDLGKKIIEMRKNAKLSQEQLAEKLDVTRQTISNWENGKFYPDIDALVKISKCFNISLDDLLSYDNKVLEYLKDSTDVVKSNKKLLYAILLNILVIILFIIVGITVNESISIIVIVFTISIISFSYLFYQIIKKLQEEIMNYILLAVFIAIYLIGVVATVYQIYKITVIDAKARDIKHPKLMGLLATSGKSSEGIILYLLHRRKYPIKNITKEEQNDIDRRKKIALVGIIFMVVGAIGFVFFIVRI